MCSSSYTTFSKAESSGLEPQLFIHLFSKQRRLARSATAKQPSDRITIHHIAIKPLVGRAGVAPATQEAAVLQTVAHADRRADLCLLIAAQV